LHRSPKKEKRKKRESIHVDEIDLIGSIVISYAIFARQTKALTHEIFIIYNYLYFTYNIKTNSKNKNRLNSELNSKLK